MIEAFAVAVVYLIMAIPIAQAASISVMFNNNPAYQPFALPEHVDISASVYGGTATIVLESTDMSELRSVYMYNCREMGDPVGCRASPLVEEYSFSAEDGKATISVPWDDIRSHDTANVLLISKTAVSRGENWVGNWLVIEKSGEDYIVTSNDLEEVELHVSELSRVQEVVQAVAARGMVPINLLTKAVMKGAGKLYELRGEMPRAAGTETEGNEVTGTGGEDYSIVFGESSGIFNAVSFYSKPPTVCGNVVCEEGETTSTCCADCGCGSDDLYCAVDLPDTADGTCMPLDDIELQLKVAPQMKVDNCQAQNMIEDILFDIGNEPPDTSLLEASCRLEGGNIGCSVGCQKAGGMFRCSVTISPIEGCTGSYVITDNEVSFRISFPDGLGMETRYLTEDIPDITVSPAVCGEFGCEEGETCCADCGCPSGMICDAVGEEPGNWKCVEAPDALIYNEGPFQFVLGENELKYKVKVTGATDSLEPGKPSCSVASCQGGEESCSASCSVSYTELEGAAPGTREFEYTLWFKVSEYDQSKGYTLFLESPVSYTYRNGFSYNTLNKVNTLMVGINKVFCGDGSCDEGAEDSESCCWDCKCEGGFCRSGDSPSPETDECVSYSDLAPQASSISAQDAIPGRQSTASIHLDFPNAPESMNVIRSRCSTEEGVYCSPLCLSDGKGGYDCTITLAGIEDYSGMPSFDGSTQTLSLGMTLGFDVSLSDGARGRVERAIGSDFTVPVRMLSECGNGICESELGETGSSCCDDCGCDDGICVNGECIPVTDVTMEIIDAEDSLECLIQPGIGERFCMFSEYPFKARLHNMPEGATVTGFEYSMSAVDGGERGTLPCLEMEQEEGTYDCSLFIFPISQTDEGDVPASLDFYFTAEYEVAGAYETFEVTGTKELTFTSRYSDALRTCMEQRVYYEEEVEDLESEETELQVLFWTVTGIAVVLFVAAVACSVLFDCGGAGEYLWYLSAVFSGLACLVFHPNLMGDLADVRSELEEAEFNLMALCDSTTIPDMSGVQDDMKDMQDEYTAEVVGATVTCVIFAVSSMVALSYLSAAASGGTEAQTAQTAWDAYEAYDALTEAHEAYGEYERTKEELEEKEAEIQQAEDDYEELYGSRQEEGFGEDGTGYFPADSGPEPAGSGEPEPVAN